MARISDTSLFNDANFVSYFKFEDTADSKGGITLTNNNSATFPAAKYENGGSLGTSNSNKSFSNNTNNPFGIGSGAFTIAGWVEILTEPGSGVLFTLFDAESTTTQVSQQLQYFNNSGTPQLVFSRTKNGVAGQGPTANITALGITSFHHIAMVYDTANVSGYLDGALIGGPTAASGDGSSGATAGVAVGINRNDLASNPASAIFDDFGVWTRGLTAAEILTLYQETLRDDRALFM